jgi:hypothetical protein
MTILPARALGDRSLSVHHILAEPQLAFHPTIADDRHSHPLQGLIQFGPYSRALPGGVIDPIRVATITPFRETHLIRDLLEELTVRHEPRERREYLPSFLGVERIFGVRVLMASDACQVELASDLDARVENSGGAHTVLSEALIRALEVLHSLRSEFNVVAIYLPDRWRKAFRGGDNEDFDLHDYVKAWAAGRGIASQFLNDDALSYQCRASTAWRLTIALYVKSGGVPWKLAGSVPGTAYVGLSYALRRATSHAARFVTCCSQVFDDDGGGLEFIAYDTRPLRVDGKNPFLSREEMRRVMARTLTLYSHQHLGKGPDRIVVHKSTRFTPEEVDGCFDALTAVPEVELLQVQDDTSWFGVKMDGPARPRVPPVATRYPVDRGTIMPFDGSEALLWTSGNAAEVTGGRNYFKEGRGIPHPLLLRRFTGSASWDETARPVLALTKMNWNNDGLYDRLPTTMGYAKVLAETMKRIDILSDRPYPFRLFM